MIIKAISEKLTVKESYDPGSGLSWPIITIITGNPPLVRLLSSHDLASFYKFYFFRLLVLVALALFGLGAVGFIYARRIRKPHPHASNFITMTSTVLVVLASMVLDRILGRPPDQAFAVHEGRNNVLPIGHETRLAIEEL